MSCTFVSPLFKLLSTASIVIVCSPTVRPEPEISCENSLPWSPFMRGVSLMYILIDFILLLSLTLPRRLKKSLL